MRTADAAIGKWHGIMEHFGIAPEYLTGRHGPCPMCGGKDRWRFADKDGRGNWFCNHCGNGDGFDFLIEYTGRSFSDLAKEIDSIIGNVEAKVVSSEKDPRERLNRIYSGLASMDSVNPVRLYLKARNLFPTHATMYHPSLAYYEDRRKVGTYPAMVHFYHDAEGNPVTLHVTYLTGQGQKAPVSSPKKVLPPIKPLAGGAVRLCDIGATLGIAEGIETAMAVSRDTGIPCWAAYSAGMLEKFEPPAGVERVVIFGDNDYSFAGHKAAYALAHRLYQTHRVEVRFPDQVGSDFADTGGAV